MGFLPDEELKMMQETGKYLEEQAEIDFPRTEVFQAHFPIGAIASAVDFSAPAHVDPKAFRVVCPSTECGGSEGGFCNRPVFLFSNVETCSCPSSWGRTHFQPQCPSLS